MSDIYDEIKAERKRQDQKWGGPEHDDKRFFSDWAEFIKQRTYDLPGGGNRSREALVEIAALAVAALESHDRNYEEDLPQ